MTFLSVAAASRRLGIDAKTLRRWLAEAQIPLHHHPQDGRKQGVSSAHLHLLAHLHQRSLTPLPPEPPALATDGEPPLPVALLAWSERLDTLHAQLAALQQQVAALTDLLQSHKPEPARPRATARSPRTTRRAAQPVSSAPRSRPTPTTRGKPPHKPAHVIPRVEYVSAGHYVVIGPKEGLLAFEADSPAWFAWLAEQSSFRFVGKLGTFSAHHEQRVPRGAWRAHRHIRNHGYHLRLAPSQELTMAVLEQAAATLQAHLK